MVSTADLWWIYDEEEHDVKIVIRAKELNAALKIMRTIIPPARTKLRQELRIACDDTSTVTFSGTNLFWSGITAIPAEVIRGGAITIPFPAFSTLVGTFAPAETVSLEIAEDHPDVLHIQSGITTTRLMGDRASTIPALGRGVLAGTVDAEAFRQAAPPVIQSTASGKMATPISSGVLVVLDGQRMVLSAANGARSTTRTLQLDGPAPTVVDAIIPGAAMNSFLSAIPTRKRPKKGAPPLAPVPITVSIESPPDEPSSLVWSCGTTTVSAIIITDTRPKAAVASSVPTTRFIGDTRMLRQVAKRLDAFCTATGKPPVVLSISRENVQISTTAPEWGGLIELLEPLVVDGDATETTLNIEDVVEALRGITTASVSIDVPHPNDERAPVLFADVNGSSDIHTATPVR